MEKFSRIFSDMLWHEFGDFGWNDPKVNNRLVCTLHLSMDSWSLNVMGLRMWTVETNFTDAWLLSYIEKSIVDDGTKYQILKPQNVFLDFIPLRHFLCRQVFKMKRLIDTNWEIVNCVIEWYH